MDKKAIVAKIREKLEADLAVLSEAATKSHEAASDPDSQAEGKYDTRALEASYLASGQSQRVQQIKQSIELLDIMEIREFQQDSPIMATALVCLRMNEQEAFYFLSPQGGGMSLQQEGKAILVISTRSPLGEALLKQKLGDLVEVEMRGGLREYEVLSIE